MSLANNRVNAKAAGRLSESIRKGNVVHAYIFEGDSLSEKEILAIDFFKALVCSHRPGEGCDVCRECHNVESLVYEDLYVLGDGEKDGAVSSIKVSDILELQKKIMRKPSGALGRNLVLIKNADKLTVEAQDKLLKTLEEPPAGTVIVLLSENTENLLITIKSRCVRYYLHSSFDGAQIEDSDFYRVAQEAIRMAVEDEIFDKQKSYLLKHIKNKDELLMFFDAMEVLLGEYIKSNRSELMDRRQAVEAIENIESCRKALAINANYKYILCGLVLKIGG